MPPIIIHVSGSPGSGKTHIMDHLPLKTGVVTKDLDDICTPMFESKEWKAIGDDDAGRARKFEIYHDYFTFGIQKFVDGHKNASLIILFGLTVFFPNFPNFSDKTKKTYADFPPNTLFRYFIDIQTKELIRRRWIREVEKEVEEDKAALLKGDGSLHFDASEIKEYASMERRAFEDRGYFFETQDVIQKHLSIFMEMFA